VGPVGLRRNPAGQQQAERGRNDEQPDLQPCGGDEGTAVRSLVRVASSTKATNAAERHEPDAATASIFPDNDQVGSVAVEGTVGRERAE
jgi:hypothetical protein